MLLQICKRLKSEDGKLGRYKIYIQFKANVRTWTIGHTRQGSYKYGSNTVVRIALRLYVMICLAPLQYVCKQRENGADICEVQKTVQTFVEG